MNAQMKAKTREQNNKSLIHVPTGIQFVFGNKLYNELLTKCCGGFPENYSPEHETFMLGGQFSG